MEIPTVFDPGKGYGVNYTGYELRNTSYEYAEGRGVVVLAADVLGADRLTSQRPFPLAGKVDQNSQPPLAQVGSDRTVRHGLILRYG
jgi:hypothetical protein